MLKNIPTCMSPDLLKALCAVGHGAKIMICDGNCGINTLGNENSYRVRVDGVSGPEILKAILQLIPLDDYIDNSVRICNTENGIAAPGVWAKYEEIVKNSEEFAKLPNGIQYQDSDEFWSVADELDLVIGTGEEDIYGNIYLQKGVIRKK
ncbi:MAG: RbsD/FucU domain-containing protein [Lachnospiraceae bacterium]|nr:RbsD/FucU domain-containing protein [Lachnospiraceae bacterium]